MRIGLPAFLAAIALIAATAASEAAEPPMSGATCGDGSCSPPEDCHTCPQDVELLRQRPMRAARGL